MEGLATQASEIQDSFTTDPEMETPGGFFVLGFVFFFLPLVPTSPYMSILSSTCFLGFMSSVSVTRNRIKILGKKIIGQL
ncbi:hypothetical protein Cadr_000012662 [Camelus dromedarius]|uniref:Uncharacterized protein n=1 Tax=Camelus dromedarius TaxID=9838 RepID=A0A5N4D8R2_CAMDR|nr:hypothetical protein Cadr_000012662 [Camelus dromedarius]